MNGYQKWVLNNIKQRCPQLFEKMTGMTIEEFERTYDARDKQFCERMKKRHDAFKTLNPEQYAYAEAGARQFFSTAGAVEEVNNNNNPTTIERTQKE